MKLHEASFGPRKDRQRMAKSERPIYGRVECRLDTNDQAYSHLSRYERPYEHLNLTMKGPHLHQL